MSYTLTLPAPDFARRRALTAAALLAVTAHAVLLLAPATPPTFQRKTLAEEPLPTLVSIPIDVLIAPPDDPVDPSKPASAKEEAGPRPQIEELIEVARPDRLGQEIQVVVPGMTSAISLTRIPAGEARSGSAQISNETFNPNQLDRIPEALSQHSLRFPENLKREVDVAEIRVTYIVAADGSVNSVRILKASHPGFERAVEEGLLRWKFRPGSKGGRKVATRLEQTLVFRTTD